MNDHRSNRGFIALFSALIISALLSLLVITSSTQSFFSRFDEFDRQSHKTAQIFSLACGKLAISKIQENFLYMPAPEGDEILHNGNACGIRSIQKQIDPTDTSYAIFTIQTDASVRSATARAVTNVRIRDPRISPSIPYKPPVIVDYSRTGNE